MVTLQIVGGGKMGEALLAGLLDQGPLTVADIYVVEKVESRRAELSDRYLGLGVGPDVIAAGGCILAVKPSDITDVAALVSSAGCSRVLSIAAGITLAAIEAAVGPDVAAVRAMPNTPSLVGQGAAAISGGTTANESDLVWAESILGSVGVVVRVAEPLLDVVTGLSGSGPAYVFLFAEAMIEAGVLAGLPRDIAEVLTAQTLLGSATLLRDGGEPAAVLRANVTSPGGTTAAGLQQLEAGGVRAAVLNAVEAAVSRARQLGG